MAIILCFLLIIWSYLVAICMAGCAITPNKNGHVTIPGDWSGLVNRAIPSQAFEECTALQSVTIGDGVKGIGEDAFQSCNALQSVTIPDSVTSMGDGAFYYCRAFP